MIFETIATADDETIIVSIDIDTYNWIIRQLFKKLEENESE